MPRRKGSGRGTIERRNGRVFLRLPLPGRPRHPLPDDLEGDELRDFADRLCARLVERWRAEQTKATTVQEFGEAWTSGRLYRKHGEVRGLRPKKSVKDDEGRLRLYVYPVIGHMPVERVGEVDVEGVMAEAARSFEERNGRPMRQGTRLQVYQVVRRLFDLAVKPGRLRGDNPVSKDIRPRKDAPQLYSYLYPNEVLEVLACPDVPLDRRVLYALAVYTGLRKGSLYALRWSGADLRHGTLTSLESKTGLPQLFEIRDDLVAMLSRWHAHLGGPGPKVPIVSPVVGGEREAEALRADLETAGIDRAVLFGGHDAIQPLRFHDLRATFITWARREGRGWGWITDRSGHVTTSQADRYDRGARTLRDLQIDAFPSLEGALPELWIDPAKVARIR